MAFFPLDMYPTYTEGYLNNEFHLYELGAVVCRLGTIRLQNGTCQQCTPGTYYNDFHGPAQCTACDAGTFLRVSGAEIFSACRGCPPGTFSGQGASQCAPCPNGTSSSRRSSRCVQCPPGTRLPDNGQGEEDCVPCAGGYSVLPNQLQCLACPPRSAAPPGATSLQQCEGCEPGTAPGPSGCEPCEQGTFSTSGLLCRRCPPGTHAQGTANTECQACPPGFISPKISFFFSRQCEFCPPDTTTFGSSSTICRREGGPCPYNHIENADGDCVRCPVDTFYDRERQVCTSCPDGFGSAGGLPLQCSPCFDIINAGVDESHCRVIFKNGVPADADGNCAPGTYVSEIDGRTCILCQEGTFSNTTNASGVVDREDGQTGCRRCPPGYVQPEVGASNCVKCEPGTEPDEFEQKCVKPQNRCEIGFSLVPQFRRSYGCEMDTCDQLVDVLELKGRVCGRCGIGQFAIEDGRCGRCPATSLGDGLRCAQCPNGMVQFGEQSRYGETCACRGVVALNRGMINGSCQLCAVGSYGSPKGGAESDHVCRKCPAGTYRNFVDENSLLACSSSGSCNAPAPCKPCEAGLFSDEDGATECKPCPPGTFSYGIGETECLEFGAASGPVAFDEPVSGGMSWVDSDGELASPVEGVASPEADEFGSPEASEEELVMPSGE